MARAYRLEHDASRTEAYLYHGTNCFRRWEIHRSGSILPGRNGYSFFCSSEDDAYNYARHACLRDIRGGPSNSLICEPIVLKVRFSERTWIQVDFVQELQSTGVDARPGLTLAVLGPIPLSNIVEVMHCVHGRPDAPIGERVRTFEDGTFLEGIRRLRKKTSCFRLEVWLHQKLKGLANHLDLWLNRWRRPTDVSADDELNRLGQIELRLRLRHGRLEYQ